MHPVLFHFYALTIYTYGFFVALAVLIAYFLAHLRARATDLDPSIAADFVFVLFVSGVIGARCFYVFQHLEDYQGQLLKIFSIPEGGLVWYGGFLMAALTGLVIALWKRWPFLRLCDLLAPIIPLAHAIGRFGCFFNGCCFGRPTHSRVGVVFEYGDVPRLPTQLFEAAGLLVLSLGLFYFSRKKRLAGESFILYLAGYGVFRFFIEFLRGDQKGYYFLTVPQWTSVLLFFGALFLFVMIQKNQRRKQS
ncbi:MAG: prolipoprotein diacylglyceryl transferase [Candidatus Omnitrophica bacterium CG07_land_8_20_14_0_80_50_8]|nr:MAG: prolipoprotein diacylglyceryl transferase [Candidatus Omnitrophica bacterium CG07_land_8_20_14_0_80_50_8]